MHKLVIATPYPGRVSTFLQDNYDLAGEQRPHGNSQVVLVADYPSGVLSRSLDQRLGFLRSLGLVKQYGVAEDL